MMEFAPLGLPAPWFSPRLNLGLGNPNSAGALIAMALVSLLPGCFGPGWRRAAGLLLALGTGVLLAMTASRGALVALGAGLVVLAWAGARGKGDQWLILAVGGIVLGLFLLSPAGRRIRPPQDDVSLATRGMIFTRVPAMVAAAPGGWGEGRSGEAYHNWFQPVGDLRNFKHVLSTHAIWLVERSWLVGAAYLAGWALALVWCAFRQPSWAAGALACWVVFAVAAGFSHVGETGWLWLLPGAWLVVASVVRMRQRRLPGWPALAGAVAAALTLFGGIIMWGRSPGDGPRLRDGIVEISGVRPGKAGMGRVSVIAEGPMRERIGQWMRSATPGDCVLEYPWREGAALRGQTLLLVGGVAKFSRDPGQPLRRVAWLSPDRVLPWNLPAEFRTVPIVVLCGESVITTIAPWQKYFAEGGPGELRISAGEGEYLSRPWERLLAAAELSEP